MTFTARYPGRCPGCGERIEPGDMVKREDLDVVHADCDDVLPDLAPKPVCSVCFVERPCECDDRA